MSPSQGTFKILLNQLSEIIWYSLIKSKGTLEIECVTGSFVYLYYLSVTLIGFLSLLPAIVWFRFYCRGQQRFLETPDPSVFPPVSSTPEALLAFTSTFFSTFLKQQCRFPVEQCEFPLPSSFKEEGKTSTPSSFTTTEGRVEGGKRQQRSGAPQISLAMSTHLPLSYIFWCFPLLWTVVLTEAR